MATLGDENESADEEKQAATEEARQKERDRLIRAAESFKVDEVRDRVAWILNHYPDARDSDVALQIRYWQTFESEFCEGDYVRLENLYQLTRPSSLIRSRARIQNTLGLFRASPEVRKRRKTLSEDQKEKAIAVVAPGKVLTVFGDESGKNEDHLIVGSVWVLDASETLRLMGRIERWKSDNGFTGEFHFKQIGRGNIATYRRFADLLVELANVVSFKTMSVERRGHKDTDAALQKLFYHLLVQGVEQEHFSGRAELPRRLEFWKDREEEGRDRLMLAELNDRLQVASAAQFDQRLAIERLTAISSEDHVLIQVADLFTGSISRTMNSPGANEKDEFARHLLDGLGMPGGPDVVQQFGDMAVHLRL